MCETYVVKKYDGKELKWEQVGQEGDYETVHNLWMMLTINGTVQTTPSSVDYYKIFARNNGKDTIYK